MQYRSKLRKILMGAILLFPLLLSSQAISAMDDDDPLFDTTELEKALSSKFRLRPRELRALHPLIKTDNRSVVMLYMSASDGHEAEYMFLWDKVRQTHTDFEAAHPNLSNRQRKVLKMAHSEFETRILGMWVEDYVALLTDLLELDPIQGSMVRMVFNNERDRRQEMIGGIGTAADAGQKEWEQLSRKRDAELLGILSTDQVKEYRSLSEPPLELFAGRATSDHSGS